MGDDHLFPNVTRGDPITAAGYNDLTSHVQGLLHGQPATDANGTQIRWVRLTQAIGPGSDWNDRNAVWQYYDTGTNKLVDTDPAQTCTIVTDPLAKYFYPIDSIIPVHAHWSGKYFPLFCNAGRMLGKTTGAVTALTPTNNYAIYTGTMGSETDAGFTTIPDAVSRVDIATDKWVLLFAVNNGWEMTPLECS